MLSLTGFVTLLATLPVLTPPAAQREVMSWIPPYSLATTRQALQHKAGEITAGQWLTRVGLQFWVPGDSGKVIYVTHEEKITDAEVTEFRTWARKNKVKVLLTIYNHDGKKWNWDNARSAFKDNQDAFVKNLVAEMERHDLDGIDLDLEGNGSFEPDRAAFASFVKKLSAELKPRKKLLTIDSFHSPCFNAPHMGWWEDWKGQVDAIHSMGYGDLYEGSTETFVPEGTSQGCMDGAAIFRFSWQAEWGKKAGFKSEQILMGFPGGRYQWGKGGRGVTLADHLAEVADQSAGICIWDLPASMGSQRDPRWGSAEGWGVLKQFREGKKIAAPPSTGSLQ